MNSYRCRGIASQRCGPDCRAFTDCPHETMPLLWQDEGDQA